MDSPSSIIEFSASTFQLSKLHRYKVRASSINQSLEAISAQSPFSSGFGSRSIASITMSAASSCGPDMMMYRCICCKGYILPEKLHILHGQPMNKHLHIGCLPHYFANFEEMLDRENKIDHRAYWRNMRKKILKFMKMKKALKPKLHRLTRSRCFTIDRQ